MKNKTIVLLALACFIMLPTLVSAADLPDQKPGLYINKEYRFSVAYPESWQPGTLLPGEVLRAANTNMYSLPVITAAIGDQKKGESLDPKVFIESAKKAEPGSDGYKVVGQEDLTLVADTQGDARVHARAVQAAHAAPDSVHIVGAQSDGISGDFRRRIDARHAVEIFRDAAQAQQFSANDGHGNAGSGTAPPARSVGRKCARA